MDSLCSPYSTAPTLVSACYSTTYLSILPNAILSFLLLLFHLLPHKQSSTSVPLSFTSLILLILLSHFTQLTLLLFIDDYQYVSAFLFLQYFGGTIQWILVLMAFQRTFSYSTCGCSVQIGLKLFWILRPIWAVVEFVLYWTNFGQPQELNDGKKIHMNQSIEFVSVIPFALLAALTFVVFKTYCSGGGQRRRYENLVDDSEVQIEKTKKTKYEEANIFSKLITAWIYPVLRIGYTRPLENTDVEGVREIESTLYQKKLLEPYVTRYMSRKDDKNALLKAMYSRFAGDIVVLTIVGFFATLMDFSGAVFIKIIENFLISDEPRWKGYALVCYMLLSKIIQAIASNHYRFQTALLSAHIKSGLSAHIFDKTLLVSPLVLNSANSTFSYAQIINLMQVDLGRIAESIPYSIRAFTWPFQFGVGVYLIFITLGWKALTSGVILMMILFGINGLIAKSMAAVQKELMEKKDLRMKTVNEWLSSMKVLKLYNWEKKIAEKVLNGRAAEMKVLIKGMKFLVGIIFLNWGTRNYLIISMLVTMTLSGVTLTPGNVFAGTSVIGTLNMSIRLIPDLINNFVQALISFKRIQDFFQCREIASKSNYVQKHGFEYAIDINSASFSYELPEENTTGELKDLKKVLKEISLKVKPGEFVAIVGKVGSGKSSIIQALLQNLNLIKTSEFSHVSIQGSVAYVSQESWIQNTTIKNNILFSSKDDTLKYEEVLRVCQLNADLDILPAGDSTEIGEKGINLSGGQKTRVAIARAVYSDADVFLLDDPLSAVDAHVGSEIFHRCFKNHLKNKTRLLVTNNQQFLPYVDKIVMVNDGKIIETGSYDELIQSDSYFRSSFLVDVTQKKSQAEAEVSKNEENSNAPKAEKKIIEVEDRVVGSVKLSVYTTYMNYAGGLKMLILVIIFMTCWQADRMYTDLYLSDWTNQSADEQKDKMVQNIVIYSVGSFSVNLFILFRLLVTVSGGIKAARTIFLKMMDALVDAPVNKFYDVTPTGRILNRLSKDQNSIDSQLLFALNACIGQIFQVFCIVCLIAYIVPYLLIAIPFALYLALKIQNFYLSSSRELMRLESISRSPIVQNFSEVVSGLSTIRAFGYQSMFISKNESLLDKNTSLAFYQQATSCWLGIALEIVSDIVLTGSSLFIVYSKGEMSPGLATLCLSYAMTLPENIYFLVFATSFLENQMVSVERCHQLAQIEGELPRERFKDKDLRNKKWPEKGKIVFDNYQMKYRDDTEVVLRGVTGKVKSCEKIGIVGRTGSGKSSICLSLFRIIEPFNGRILIDGVDIEEIGLDLLRQKVCVIPQDPMLFQASLRENLDPFHEYTDQRLAETLQHVQLFQGEDLIKALDTDIKEGGSNFSAGQRQLVCIARALLRNSKIIFLDEATASIDYKTDAIIQEVIKREFKQCTVLTIAHRINTIMDYDRVMVMDRGVIAEFDTPERLIEKKGIFYNLVYKDKEI